MLELIGVDGLTQWDVGRQINVDKDIDMVHFSNRPYGYSKNVKVTDGVADVPDMFLTSCAPLRVWAYVGDFEKGYTKIEKIYEVKPKNRPEDYIYTPEEVKTWEKLQSEIGNLSDLATKAKENLVAAINEVAADMSEGVALDTTLTQSGQAADAKAVGDALAEKQSKGDYLTQDNLQSATDAVLAQAKASGEFDGADGKSAYQYAQDGGYTGTETEFAEKLAKEIPEALPNPNALTLTGAVNATYDGSTAVSVEIPSGGSGGTDISLGLTSAAVGQIIKVKAVDESGKPTAWEAADMPSGGGSDWVKVADVTYNSNKEVVVESIDYESGVFTSTNHGLQNGETVYFVPNSVYEYSPEKYMPGGTLSGTKYKVTNATENTFALTGVTMTANQDIDFTKWHLETNDNYGSSLFISNLKLMNDVKVISYGKTVSFNDFSTCAAEINNVLSTAGAYEGKLPNNYFYDGFGYIGYEVFIGDIFGCCETVITRLDKTHIRSEITALSSNAKKSSDWGVNSNISHAVAIAECLESFKHPTELDYWNFFPANGYRIEVYTK